MSSFTVPADHYLLVDRLHIRYWCMGGETEPGGGEPDSTIILLHGGTGSIEFWVYNMAVLARSHRVYAFDMVGSGRSDRPSASYSLTYQARFLESLMKAWEIPRATLIGTSMGGGVALQFTLMYPDRVDKLVLVDSMGFGREINLGIRLISLPGIWRSLRPGRWMIPGMLRANFYNGSSISSAWVELRYQIFALPGRERAIGELGRTNFNLRGVRPEIYQPILQNLHQIKQETLIIWGENDRIIPVKHGHIAAARIPNSQLSLFAQCGHHPYLEHPDRFNQLVLNFLAKPPLPYLG
jgi:4,5:9,10-diseco-3-hydroxy-5,9,17-trioxoandrosta-1(10),2-diene-4-oate hydrolase